MPLGGAKAAASEVQTLQAACGRGYARLLCHQFESGAMLLERLGPQLAQMDVPLDSRLQTICETLKSAWMPLPPGMRVMTGREKAQSMTTYIRPVWRRLGRPCSEKVIAVALRFGQARSDAFDPATAVLGQGDPHCWNTLFDPRSGAFRFVDPEGLFIERAHDLSISMREWSAELLAGDPVIVGKRRCELLAHAAGIDPSPIWQWGFIERLVNGLLYLERGLDGTAQEFLEVAEAWALAEAG
jgi:streptomycin 6-kinase